MERTNGAYDEDLPTRRETPLDGVLSVVEGCHAAGHRVVAAWDETPLATAVIDRIRQAGVPVVAFPASQPPHHWGEGTDALIEAASLGTDGLLYDLIARGAGVHHQDDSGSTALHHAAANGSLHALEALVAAGAAVDQANQNGFTPHMLAMACRQAVAAQRLADLGADVASGPVGAVRFRRAHYGTLYVWFAPLILATLLIAFLWPLTPPGLFGVAAYLAVYAAVVPGRAFWAGGVPRQLDSATLNAAGRHRRDPPRRPHRGHSRRGRRGRGPYERPGSALVAARPPRRASGDAPCPAPPPPSRR